MSSSAALAAAKKRRNPGSMEQYTSQTGSMSHQEIQQPRAPTNVNQLIVQHDARLFMLEKQFSTSKNEYALKRDVELLQLTNSTQNLGITSNVDNAITNKLEKQVKDLAAFNVTVTKLNKSATDTNTMITTLRASVLLQAKEIEELKQSKEQLNDVAQLKAQLMEYNQVKVEFYKFLDEYKNKSKNTLDETPLVETPLTEITAEIS